MVLTTAEQATTLIPDISAFNDFMSATEIDQSAHSIAELLEPIINDFAARLAVKLIARLNSALARSACSERPPPPRRGPPLRPSGSAGLRSGKGLRRDANTTPTTTP